MCAEMKIKDKCSRKRDELDQSKRNVSFYDHHGMDETIMEEDIPEDVDYDQIQ